MRPKITYHPSHPLRSTEPSQFRASSKRYDTPHPNKSLLKNLITLLSPALPHSLVDVDRRLRNEYITIISAEMDKYKHATVTYTTTKQPIPKCKYTHKTQTIEEQNQHMIQELLLKRANIIKYKLANYAHVHTGVKTPLFQLCFQNVDLKEESDLIRRARLNNQDVLLDERLEMIKRQQTEA